MKKKLIKNYRLKTVERLDWTTGGLKDRVLNVEISRRQDIQGKHPILNDPILTTFAVTVVIL